MTLLLLVALGFAPGLFWMGFFYQKDRLEPEPLRLLVWAGFCGVCAAIPAYFLEAALAFSDAALAVVGAPVIEELLKFLTVWLVFFRRREFNEPMDGVIYAAAVALGFASIENGLYLTNEYYSGTGDVPLVLIARSVISVPGHVLFSTFWGEALGRAKFLDSRSRRRIVARGLLWSMLAHAVFNLLLTLNILAGVVYFLLPRLWSRFNTHVAHVSLLSPFRKRTRDRGEPGTPTPAGNGPASVARVLPERIVCASCDEYLELSEEERKSGRFVCPVCGGENTRRPEVEDPGDPLAIPPPPLDLFVICPHCSAELELEPEERQSAMFVCPECLHRYEAAREGGTAELVQFLLPSLARCPLCGFVQRLTGTARKCREFVCAGCGEAIEHVET